MMQKIVIPPKSNWQTRQPKSNKKKKTPQFLNGYRTVLEILNFKKLISLFSLCMLPYCIGKKTQKIPGMEDTLPWLLLISIFVNINYNLHYDWIYNKVEK